MRINSIKSVGKKPVYDITVSNIHHYFLKNGVVTHNSGGLYAANTIFFITKAQEKDGTDLAGYKFTINIEKSRYVREKAKFPFVVTYEKGIDKYSGLLDYALQGEFVIKPSMGWYQKVDPDTGEVLEGKYREKDTHNKAFWDMYLSSDKFLDYCSSRVKLGSVKLDKETLEELE